MVAPYMEDLIHGSLGLSKSPSLKLLKISAATFAQITL